MFPLVFLIFMRFSSEASSVSETIPVVVDLIKAQELPGNVNAYICWSSGEKLELWKTLSKNFVSAKIIEPRGPLPYSYHSENQQIFFIDMNCEGSKNILQQAEISTLFRYPFRWIIMAGETDLNFSEYFFGVDSKMFVIVKKDTHFQVRLPYKITKNDTKIIENDLATWENGKWLYYNKFSVPRNRSNLMGSNFRVSYVIENPDSMNHLTDYRDGQIDRLGKTCYLVVQSLLPALNVVEIATFHNTWGYPAPGTSQLNGMLGDFQRNKTDMGGCSALLTPARISVHDPVVQATATIHSRIVYRAPLLAFVSNIFVLPFDAYVWISCLSLGLVILLILFIIVLWEWRDPVAKEEINPTLRPNIFDVFIMELGAITQQGAEKEPKSVSGRMATLFTFIALMFIYNAFCANIVALLQSTKDSISSVEDLYTTDISVGSHDCAWCKYFLENDPRPELRALAKKKVKYMNVTEGVERIRTEYFAYIAEQSLIYNIVVKTFTESEKCALRDISWLPKTWFSVPKHTTYKELIRFFMKRTKEAGLTQRNELLLFTGKPPCNNQGNFGTVGITECRSIYVYFGVGIVMSFSILLLEILFKIISKKLASKYELNMVQPIN